MQMACPTSLTANGGFLKAEGTAANGLFLLHPLSLSRPILVLKGQAPWNGRGGSTYLDPRQYAAPKRVIEWFFVE